MKAEATNINLKKNKIIWAVDPTQNPADAKRLIKEMSLWADSLNCVIQPVSIFSDKMLGFPVELALPWKNDFIEVIKKSTHQYFKKISIKNLNPPKTLLISSNSNRKMALRLAQYAEKEKAQMIFAHTRAQKTWNPFRLGGFAETLAAVSRIPVLLLNPNSVPSANMTSILFPTNFSHDSKIALTNLSPWAEVFHSKVLLYSQVETPTIYASDLHNNWPAQIESFKTMMKNVENERQKVAKEWSEVLHNKNIKTKVLIQRQKRSLGIDILEAAKKNKVKLIALASNSGPITQAFLGSVARDVLLQAKCPVLIFYRPKLKRVSKIEVRPKTKVHKPDASPSLVSRDPLDVQF